MTKKRKQPTVAELKQRLYDELDGTGVIAPWRSEAIVNLIDELIEAKLNERLGIKGKTI